MNDEQNKESVPVNTTERLIGYANKFQEWRKAHPVLTLALGIVMLSVLQYKSAE